MWLGENVVLLSHNVTQATLQALGSENVAWWHLCGLVHQILVQRFMWLPAMQCIVAPSRFQATVVAGIQATTALHCRKPHHAAPAR